MFNVLVAFKDLEDKNHIYQVNHTYPRDENKKVTKERIESLSSTNNLRGKVLIERNKLEDIEVEDLKKYCKIMDYKYSKNAEKEDLIEVINKSEEIKTDSIVTNPDTTDETSDDVFTSVEGNPDITDNE